MKHIHGDFVFTNTFSALNTVHPRLRVCAMLVLVVLISLFHTQAHIGHDRSKNGHFNHGQVIYWSTLTQLPDNHSWQSHSLAYWNWWVDWRLVIGGSYINTLLTFDPYLLLICCSSLGWLSGFFLFKVTPSRLTVPLLLYFLLLSLFLIHTHSFILGFYSCVFILIFVVFLAKSCWSQSLPKLFITTISIILISSRPLLFFLFHIQTRDDFLGQVDVPLTHLPVSSCALVTFK